MSFFFAQPLDGIPDEISLWFNRSRSWVAEEGEVFRKGTVLLGPAEMEGEYAGEELRKEVNFFLYSKRFFFSNNC